MSKTGASNEMDANQLKSLFAQSKLNSGDDKDMKLTDKEKAGFTKAFEDPEFRKMFAEYMDEMQDPKYREETDAYIRQLEKEEKVPEGKELIHPKPEFVAKTYKLDDKNEKGDKLWMNITSSDNVAEPSKQVVKGGESWSLPYSLGPPRMEKDKNGDNVATFDCCFHPKALTMGYQRKEFKDLLVNTSMEGVTESYRRQNAPVKLDKNFHILKGVSYKSGITATMMVDKKSKATWKGDPDAEKIGGGNRVEELPPGPGPKALADKLVGGDVQKQKLNPPAPPTTTATGTKKDPSIKKGFLGGKSPQAPAPTPAPAPTAPAKPDLTVVSTTKKASMPAANEPVNALEPVYDIVERGIVDLGEFELSNADGSTTEKARSTRPKELVIKIKLPKLGAKSVAGVNLDISERKLSLTYPDVYDLQLSLPYPVDDTEGTAKYEKNSQSLVVTLPVKASTVALPPRTVAPSVATKGGSASEVGNDKKSAKSSPKKEQASPPKANTNRTAEGETPTSPSGENQSGLMSLDEKELDATRSLKEEIAAAAAKAKVEAEKSKKEGKKKNPAKSKEREVAAKSVKASNIAPLDANAAPFIESDSFSGRKEGYVFKRGAEGVGYYLDKFYAKAQEAAASPDLKGEKEKVTSPVVKKDKKEKAVKEIETTVPEFEYRQTAAAISLIVKVRGVTANSAKVNFQSRAVEVSFTAADDMCEEKKAGDSPSSRRYSFKIALREAAPQAYTLDPSECKFDVAQENVVLVLIKKSPGIWTEGVSASEKLLQGTVLDKLVAKTSTTPSTSTSVSKMATNVYEMKLAESSTAAIYELD